MPPTDATITPTAPPVKCELGLTPCSSNTQCIQDNWFCDEVADCRDGSDENQVKCGWNDTEPTPEPKFPNGIELNCNFENPDRRLCNYQASNGSYTWSIQQGATLTDSTGPQFDHSYQDQTGHYIFTESTYGSFNDITSLVSGFVRTDNETSSLRFFYHMYGENMGSLSVNFDIREKGQMKKEQKWIKSGDNGNYWMMACIPLPANTVLRTQFIANRGRLPTSDIAIDDIKYSMEPCQKLPCKFDDWMCGEVVSPTGENPALYKWRTQRSVAMWNMAEEMGLLGDHTMGSKLARYIVANSSEGSSGDKTTYRTPPFSNENNASLNFRYFINGINVDKLTVNIRQGNSLVSKTWSKNNEDSRSWHRGCLHVAGNIEAVAEFIANHGSGPDGVIAVDDIVLLKSQSCDTITECDLGKDIYCGFKVSGDNTYRWQVRDNIRGQYIEAIGENKEGLKTMLTSETFTPVSNDNIILQYYMAGSISLYINAMEKDSEGQETMTTLWTGSSQVTPDMLNPPPSEDLQNMQLSAVKETSNQNDQMDWMKVCVPLPSKPLKIQIVSLKRDVVADSMALKYVGISDEKCKVGLMMTNCSFKEPNMCNYDIDCSTSTQFMWHRTTGFKAKGLTGPQRDHTSNTTGGHFLQTGSSKGRPGDKTNVIFPNIKESKTSSFRFYYYMYGSDTGSLQVTVNEKIMWKETGAKTPFWYMGCVDLPLDTQVNVSLTATRGMGPLGDIAIDDVSLSHYSCPPRKIDCSFEDEMMCGYTNLPASQADNKAMVEDQWFRSNLSLKEMSITETKFVNDYYLLTTRPSRIRSPMMLSPTASCLQFSYFILMGEGTNITVTAIYDDSSKTEEYMFGTNNFTWADWRFGQINLESGNVALEFSVQAYDQKVTHTFFAIDDVKVIPNTCQPLVCSNADLKKCSKDDVCIPKYQFCDNVKDCADGSDEDGCTSFSKDIRLVDGITTGDKGRVEVLVNGSWGRVYALQWSEVSANVACKQLGFTGYAQSIGFGKYHYGVGTLWKVKCFGNESRIQDCNLDRMEKISHPLSDVGLVCYNTTCATSKTPCPQSSNMTYTYCLFEDQFCDGDYDCPDHSDEKNCSKCQNDEFYCKNKECIPSLKYCDGRTDCKDASDEINCISKDSKGHVSVFHAGEILPLCVDTNKSNAGIYSTVCMNTAQGVLDVSLTGKNVSKGVMATYDATAKSVFGSYKLSTVSSCTQARIQCNKPECGKQPKSMTSVAKFVQYGAQALFAEYPWQGMLLRNGKFICGVTIKSTRWCITAAHCVIEKGVQYEVAVGLTLKDNLPSAPKYKVKAIHHHPNSVIVDGIPYSDIALLFLEDEIQFTNSIQPACLPSKVYTKHDDCYLSGWGRNENLITQNHLQEAKVTVVDNKECEKFYKINISIICFKHNYPNMPSCYGDSGGPLVCRNSYGRFELVGVVSFGYPLCSAPNGTAAAFVNVLAMRGWIVDKTRCIIRCPENNKCLYEPEICDGVSHCNDSRDEKSPYCSLSVQCKFGTPFKCGYKNVSSSSPWYWTSTRHKSPGITYQPSTGGDEETDEFMIASPNATKDKPAVLESPVFSNILCISFLYIAHSNSSSTQAVLSVKAEIENSSAVLPIWTNSDSSNVILGNAYPHWKLVRLPLPNNTKSFMFEAYYMNPDMASFITIDDVQAQGENCKQNCPENFYKCKNGVCIKNSYRCNRIAECSDGSDETDCNQVPEGICGKDQFRCNDGECIEAYEVCDGVQHCKDGKDERNCIKSTTQHPVSCGWGRFRCEDGSCIDSLLKCDGVNHCKDGSDERYCFKTSTVYPGLCRWNQYRCNNGQCIDMKQKCDRIKQCSDGSDEQYCKEIVTVPAGKCNWHQFQCVNGQCIESYLKCDRIWHCQDGSDEQHCSKPNQKTECENHGFLCEDGKCLQRKLVCDGVYDCPRGDDERNCEASKEKKKPIKKTTTTTTVPTTTTTVKTQFCRKGEFDCGNKQCIPLAFVCDVIPDCDNDRDEENCTVIDITLPPPHRKACKPNEFYCDENQCIPKDYVCDVIPDCENGHDELNCSVPTSNSSQAALKGCIDGFKPCLDGVCVSGNKFCDGLPDCLDKSDEFNCTLFGSTTNITAKKACFSNQFQCKNGRCIPQHQRCDDWPDCEDKSDEEKCIVPPVGESQSLTQTKNKDKTGLCPSGSFHCPNGLCISQSKLCDGWPDCQDLSDEKHCIATTKKPPPTVQTTVASTTFDHLITSPSSPSGKASLTTPRKPFKVNSDISLNHTDALQESQPMTQPFTTDVLHTSSPFVKPTTTPLANQEKLHSSTQSFLSQNPSTPTLRKIRPTAAKFPRISGCLPGHFHCTSGGCIHQVNRCDGWTHCDDNSDETDCFAPEQTSWPTETRCPSTNFRCGDGTCIELDDICDGWFDCKDKSDEMQCSYKINSKNTSEANGCANDEFRCLTGLCIPLPFRCDTVIDCDDKTDEEGCHQNAMPTVATLPGCKPNEFHCKIGQCIDQAFICDGLYDCPDASDEKNCPVGGSTIPATTTEATDVSACMKNEHMCQNGKCIHQNYVCDGIPDCPNGQEEMNCKEKSTIPASEETPSDSCIPLTIKECQGLGYTLTYLPNVFGDETFQEARNRFYQSAMPILQHSCTPLALTLLCGTIFPFCDYGVSKYTCKHICDGK
ncbi:and LDL-receptor class A domain-containing 2 [Octopus vulgaris]|uniref:And LDL-receptor class A domain-containing 2 n=1 Tax=Octopus vulgaris TaxID=6645 RepID=A0AA36BS18_OCTVU|nr:and LDL-receptor class A domain-containing 2 [Octopus vulgaris]